ncbi:hypothetical protein OC844_004469 [Tilletia horrida]|nr:hypothetical protein OC844_004469 [Tilletia horrida]
MTGDSGTHGLQDEDGDHPMADSGGGQENGPGAQDPPPSAAVPVDDTDGEAAADEDEGKNKEDASTQSDASEWTVKDRMEEAAEEPLRRSTVVDPWHCSFRCQGEAAPQDIVGLHDEIAALTLQCSDMIYDALESIQWLILDFSKHERLLSPIHAFCRRLLRFLLAVAKHEAAHGNRDQMGTAKSIYLHIVAAAIHSWQDLQCSSDYKIAYLSSRARRRVRRSMIRMNLRFKKLVAEAELQLGVISKHRRLAVELLGRPESVLESATIFRHLRKALDSALGQADVGYEDLKERVCKLLQLCPLLDGILWTPDTLNAGASEHKRKRDSFEPSQNETENEERPQHDQPWIPTTEAISNLPPGELGPAARLFLTRGVHLLALPRNLAFEDHAAAQRWMDEISYATIVAAHVLALPKRLKTADAFVRLHGILVTLCLNGSYKAASTFAEVLTITLREQLERDPSSTQIRMRLANALGALGWLLWASDDDFEAISAAREAMRILQPLQDPKHPRRSLPLGRIGSLRSRWLLEAELIYDQDEVDTSVSLIRQVLKHRSDDDDVRQALAEALDTQFRCSWYHPAQVASIKAELLRLYRVLNQARPHLYECELEQLLRDTSIPVDDDQQRVSNYDEAIRITSNLTRRFPDSYAYQLEGAYLELGCFHADRRNFPEAMDALQRGINLSTPRTASSAGSKHSYCASALLQARAKVFFEMEMYVSATTDAQSALACAGRSITGRAEALRLIAFSQLLSGDAAEAAVQFSSVMETLKKEYRSLHARSVRHSPDYILMLGQLGAVECANGDVEKAWATGADAVHLGRRWLKHETDRVSKVKHAHGCNLLYLAATLIEAARLDEAESRLLQSLRQLEGRADGRVQLKTALVLLARVQNALGRAAEAAETQAQADAMPERGFAARLGRAASS